jgi:hypothetical protein
VKALEVDARVVDQQVDGFVAKVPLEISGLARVGHVDPMQAHRGMSVRQVLEIHRPVRIAAGGENPLSPPGALADPLQAEAAVASRDQYPLHG